MFGTMSIGGVLDVAIGLMFIYFLLAQIATGLQEVLAGFAAWRGSYLTKGVDVLMSNDNVAFNFWKDFFTTHFLPSAPPTEAERKLANPPPPQPQPAAAAQPPQPPAAAAAPPQPPPALTGEPLLTMVQDVMNHPLMRGTPSANPSYIPAQKFSMALLDLLRNGSQAPLFTQAEATINNLPEGQLKKTLSVFIRDAGGDVDKLRAHIETWFDDAMDELTTIYKRLSRFAMVFLGLIVAATLNVDSIDVADFLWASPAVASGLLTQAAAAQAPAGSGDAAAVAPGEKATPAPAAGQGTTDHSAAAQNAMVKLRSLPLPIGWKSNQSSTILDLIGQHILGWLITAIAVSLGAPFWFGLMQNLLNIRSGSKPPRADATPTASLKIS